jgi:hypothetical protein
MDVTGVISDLHSEFEEIDLRLSSLTRYLRALRSSSGVCWSRGVRSTAITCCAASPEEFDKPQVPRRQKDLRYEKRRIIPTAVRVDDPAAGN